MRKLPDAAIQSVRLAQHACGGRDVRAHTSTFVSVDMIGNTQRQLVKQAYVAQFLLMKAGILHLVC